MDNNDFNLLDLADDENSAIGKRLQMLRADILHMNQRECSDILGISQTYLSLLETGKRKINYETLNLYSNKLNANPNWILYGESENGITKDIQSIDKDHFIQKQHKDCIDSVKKTFNLNDEEADFISRLLSQETAKRRNFIRTLQDLKNLID